MVIPPCFDPIFADKDKVVNLWGFGHGGGKDGKSIKQVKIKERS